MHDVLGAKCSARNHKEGRGDQGPQGEAYELLFLGFRWGWRYRRKNYLRFPGGRANSCQFLCGPPKRLTLTTSAVAAEAPGNCDSRDSGSWFAISRIQVIRCCGKGIFVNICAEGQCGSNHDFRLGIPVWKVPKACQRWDDLVGQKAAWDRPLGHGLSIGASG